MHNYTLFTDGPPSVNILKIWI